MFISSGVVAVTVLLPHFPDVSGRIRIRILKLRSAGTSPGMFAVSSGQASVETASAMRHLQSVATLAHALSSHYWQRLNEKKKQ